MRKVLLGLLFILLTTGCGTTQPTEALNVFIAATNLKYHYENGGIVNFVGNAQLTDAELTTVVHSLDQIDESKRRIEKMMNKPDQLLIFLPIITAEYAQVRLAYMDIRAIVVAHKDNYTVHEWRELEGFDIAVQQLDKQFVSLVQTSEKNAALSSIVRLADTALKLAAIL